MRLGVKHASGVTPRESQTETGFADTGAGQGGMHRESKTDMHTPPCVVGQDRVGCAERTGPTCTHHRVWRRWPVGGRWTARGAQPVNEWGGGGEREGM